MTRPSWKHFHWCPECDTQHGPCMYGEECRVGDVYWLCWMCHELMKVEVQMRDKENRR